MIIVLLALVSLSVLTVAAFVIYANVYTYHPYPHKWSADDFISSIPVAIVALTIVAGIWTTYFSFPSHC